MKRKITCIFLSILILSCLCAPAYASSPLSCSASTTTGDLIMLSSVEEFESALGHRSNPLTSTRGDASSPTTNYSYAIQIPNNSTCGTATVTFTLNISGVSYPVTTSGNVSVIEINEDYTLIRGFLKGVLNINNKAYSVDVGLNKLAHLDTISAGITLTPEDFYSNETSRQLYFCFGTSVMTEDFIPAYLAHIESQKETTQNETMVPSSSPATHVASTTSSMSLLTSSRGNFISSGVFTGSGTASRLYAYRDSANKRFVLRLRSYTGNMSYDDFPTSQFIAASIGEYCVGLERVGSKTSISSIEGIAGIVRKESGHPNYQTRVLGTLLVGIIDLLTEYGFEANLLQSMLDGVTGDAYYVHDGSDSFLDVSIDNMGVDFDDSDAYLTIGFNILTNGLTGTYRGYSTLTYQVDTQFATLLVSTTPITTTSFTVS